MNKKRKLQLMLALSLSLSSFGQAFAQQQKVTLNLKDVTVSKVLMEVNRQTNINFVYNASQLASFGPVSVHASGESVSAVLGRLFENKPYTVKYENNSIVILPAQKNDATHYLSGVIRDEQGEPLPGVTVTVGNGRYGTISDANGHYRLFVKGMKGQQLKFTFVGMKEKKVTYAGQSLLNVVMAEDASKLGDVIVTGYGTYKRGEYVGAVTQIKADDIKIAGESSIDQMLQGVVPGMSVVNTTGKVGGNPKIRIRGTSTLLGNQEPLWVVDDVIQTNPNPIPNDASPLSSNADELSETAGNAISWLNPADIETITVLKDASATAIYGSQAANGVIVITTKKAKAGSGLSVNYSGNVSISQKPSYGMYDMMNSQEYMRFQQEMWQDRNSYTSSVLPISYAGLMQQLRNKEITKEEFDTQFRKYEMMNTDWFDILFRNAVTNQHNVSISQSGDRLSSRFSVGINNTPGEARGNDMFQFTANSNTTYRLGDKLIIDLSMSGSYRKTNNFAFGVSPYDYAMNTTRSIPLYNDDGTLFYHAKNGTMSYSFPNRYYYNYNILNEIDNTGTKTYGNTFQAVLNLKYNIAKHFQLQGTGSISLASSKTKSWATEYSNYISSIRGYEYGEAEPNSKEEKASILPFGGLLNTQDNNNVNYSFRGAVVYTNQFNKKHNLTANAGIQLTSDKMDGNTALRYGYLYYRGETFATVPKTVESAIGSLNSTDLHEYMRKGSSVVNTTSNTLSEYLTLVYNYDNRYVVNVNGRLDASNRFGQDENKKFNPSISLGGKWRIGEEPFMAWARSWYDMFDISFSYGWRGNAVTAVSPYLIAEDGGLDTYYHQYVLRIKSLPYSNLGWEKTQDWNLGVNFSFFDGRLSAGFNAYGKNSKVLSSHEVPIENGVSNAYVDGTTMKNHGWELIVSGTPIRTKDWTWSLSFNTGKVSNTVTNNKRINSLSDYLNGTAIVDGQPYGTFYAYNFTGLDHKTGQPVFAGVSRDELTEKTTDDYLSYLVKAGCSEPDISGGISTSLRYKQFHLRATFAMSLGAQKYLYNYFATSGAPLPEQNVPRYMFNRWRQPGDEAWTDIPSIPAGNPNDLDAFLPTGERVSVYTMYNTSTARVANADFIRCRSIALQYDLPFSVVRHIGMRSAFVSVSMTNPFFIAFDGKWKGRDPETASWPQRRTVSLSLNVNF